METEVATIYIQVRLPVGEGRHHPTHRTSGLYFAMTTRFTWVKMEQRFTGWTTNDLPKLKPIPWQ